MRPITLATSTVLLALFGCARGGDDDAGPSDPGFDPPDLEDVQPTDTAAPDTPGDTTDPIPGTTGIACDALPAVANVERIDIATEEDFDFDLEGYLVFQQFSDLVGRKFDGTFQVISPGVSVDAAGIQTLSDGNIVVASPDTGGIEIVNRATGANSLLVGGLSHPNGLEIGPGDTVYFTEFFGNRVRWIDPATGDGGEISASVNQPNGLAFSSDAQTLYVTANGAGSEGIVKFSRTAGGSFDDGAVFLAGAPGDFFDSVETDVCGNVYTVEYATGHVFRVTPDGVTRELIADLDEAGFEGFAAIKWGNDLDIWSSSKLYVSNRSTVFALDVGVQGSPDVLPPF